MMSNVKGASNGAGLIDGPSFTRDGVATSRLVRTKTVVSSSRKAFGERTHARLLDHSSANLNFTTLFQIISE